MQAITHQAFDDVGALSSHALFIGYAGSTDKLAEMAVVAQTLSIIIMKKAHHLEDSDYQARPAVPTWNTGLFRF